MSPKRWGERLKIGLIVYACFFVVIVLFLGLFVGTTTLVPTLVIFALLLLPLAVYKVLFKKHWRCPTCQNRLPVNWRIIPMRRRGVSILAIPNVDTPYCPKCGGDIDMDPVVPNIVSEAMLTRAMLLTFLYRLAEEPAVVSSPTSRFSDVPSGQWFSEAVAWGVHHEIVLEAGSGEFEPHTDVTREQFVAMLYRYSVMKSVVAEVPADFDLTTAPDYEQISTWAKEPMVWAVYHGLLTVTEAQGRLNPSGGVPRSGSAAILQRFVRVMGAEVG